MAPNTLEAISTETELLDGAAVLSPKADAQTAALSTWQLLLAVSSATSQTQTEVN